MGKYVTPAGVEIEMGDEAARTIGFKSAGEKSEPKKSTPKKASSSKSDKSSKS